MNASRLKLLALVAIAVAPVVAAYLLYFSMRGNEPWGTTNHGELLDPPPAAATLSFVDARDGTTPVVFDDSRWRLLVVVPGACDAACDDALFQLRQLHVLLNNDADRVRRVLVLTGAVPGPLDELRARYPELALLALRAGSLDDGIYIVDPHGNLVLRYALADAGKPVLEDLQKLLRVSQIG